MCMMCTIAVYTVAIIIINAMNKITKKLQETKNKVTDYGCTLYNEAVAEQHDDRMEYIFPQMSREDIDRVLEENLIKLND